MRIRLALLAAIFAACAAAALAHAAEPAAFWLSVRPITLAPPAESALRDLAGVMSDPQPRPMVQRVARAGVHLAALGAPAEIVVSRWSDADATESARWVARVQFADDGSAERFAKTLPAERNFRAAASGADLILLAGPDSASRAAEIPPPAGAEFEAHVRVAAVPDDRAGPLSVYIDLNALRRHAPEAFSRGPEARLLAALGLSNARAVALRTRLHPLPPGGPAAAMLTAEITWSARSRPPGEVSRLTLGESKVGGSSQPPGSPRPAWVFATPIDPGTHPLARGWGGHIRQAASLALAAEPGLRNADQDGQDAQQRWFLKMSEQTRAITTRLGPRLRITPDEQGLVLSAGLRDGDQTDRHAQALTDAIRTLTQGLPGVITSDRRVTLPLAGLALALTFDPTAKGQLDVRISPISAPIK
jgi:hypothetical protein